MREKEARNKRKKIFALALFLVLIGEFGPPLLSQEPGLVAWWKFDQIDKLKANKVLDTIGEIEDVIEGNFKSTRGVVGSALKLDGYTTCIVRDANNVPPLKDEFTFEAWLALGAYPWNWCPILSQHESKKAGFYFAVGPRGELSLQVALNGKWQECTSPDFIIPLRKWVQVAGVYDSSEGLIIYLNGRPVGNLKVKGKITFASDVELRIGMNHEKLKPAYIHREHGTLPGWFSLDGIIDEVKIFNRALTPRQIKANYSENKPKVLPDLPP
ncbi:MAG: LamG domain-containing protein, partial [Candidatus Aminicenantes bacterium]|nr:LamG domain-containing protein [Candidatus Aminicenantes bacterium]